MANKLFLLGGHDLEMQTIAEILKEKGLLFSDFSLSWNNAHLSQYRKELEQYGNNPSWTIYGIELQEDITAPDNYIRIDHHNDYSQHLSALEQITNLLNMPLNRYMQLVATNDKTYIPGMIEAGATPDEIKDIRKADRKAQGITEEEERLAEKAIKESCSTVGKLIIVHALSSRFSPICDRLFPFHSLLVHTDYEWMFYGKGADCVSLLFEKEIKAGRIFYGGGSNGYVGTVEKAYNTAVLQKMVEQIKDTYL